MVDRVRTQNTRYFSNRWIRESLPELQAGNVPRLPELQAELAALNARTPDLAVTPVLKAGRTPGTVDINLKVVDTLPLHESLDALRWRGPNLPLLEPLCERLGDGKLVELAVRTFEARPAHG